MEFGGRGGRATVTHSSTETPPVGNEQWRVAACQRHESYNLPRRFVGSSVTRTPPTITGHTTADTGIILQGKCAGNKHATATTSEFNLNYLVPA